jgi:hypothetical protein
LMTQSREAGRKRHSVNYLEGMKNEGERDREKERERERERERENPAAAALSKQGSKEQSRLLHLLKV